MNSAIYQYFDRANWSCHNATNDTLDEIVKSHLIAFAVSACQSLREALDQLVEDESQPNPKLKSEIRKLPHGHLIENIRNMDLHGWPLPICDPKVRMVEMVSKPGKPMKISSSHGVGVTIKMEGLKPKVHRSPKDIKHGKFSPGGATVSLGCIEGKIYVYDFSTDKNYLLLEVIQTFLKACQMIIKNNSPTESETEQPTDLTETQE